MDKKVQRARIFIRNLPFCVTDEKLKEHFEKFGTIQEINLLKKGNGHLLGCGFVQFETPHGAMEAIGKTNDEMFLGRKISCQLAVYKDRHNKKLKQEIEIKEEQSDADVTKEENEELTVEIKINESKTKENITRKRKISNGEKTIQIDVDQDEPKLKLKKKQIGNDLTDGKTVFVKNVPFTATDDDVKNSFSKYGDLEYGLIVKDKYTEHSKGTAFVKFINKEGAEKCLEAGTELQIEGNILDCHVALSKQELEKTVAERLETVENDLPIKKDKQRSKFPRNLHLLNEGGILAGSPAAVSVSSADMQLRLSIAQQRQRRLRAEPNLVISDRRLIVHNLPAEWTDRKLLAMCKTYGVTVTKNKGKGKKRKGNVKEARVMMNRDAEKSSKCYAYVGCETHEVALNLLRAINNNPDAFGPPPSPQKRPIVYFSIEDRRVLHKLDKRQQNGNKKINDSSKNNSDNINSSKNLSEKSNRFENTKSNNTRAFEEGTTSSSTKKTDNQHKSNPLKARLKHNPRRQLQLHHEQIKQRKQKQRLNKPMKEHKNHQRMSKNDFKSIGKDIFTKLRKKGQGDDDFSKIVAGYRSKLSAASLTATKTKWYES